MFASRQPSELLSITLQNGPQIVFNSIVCATAHKYLINSSGILVILNGACPCGHTCCGRVECAGCCFEQSITQCKLTNGSSSCSMICSSLQSPSANKSKSHPHTVTCSTASCVMDHPGVVTFSLMACLPTRGDMRAMCLLLSLIQA